MSHFFPQTTKYIWGYAGLLYWATMYLTHHYLVDVVGGACLATAMFYIFLPDEMRGPAAVAPPGGGRLNRSRSQRSKYKLYDLEAPRTRANVRSNGHFMAEATGLASEGSSGHESDEEEMDITFRSPIPGGTPTSTMGMMSQQQQSAAQAKKSHRHTASSASLIRADERGEDGWSPISTGGFHFPPTPIRTESEEVRR